MSNVPRRHSCVLKMLENPMLSGILLGLDWDDTDLVKKDKDFFLCCGGEGRFEPVPGYAQFCSLNMRLAQTQKLMASAARAWGPTFVKSLFQVPAKTSLRILDKVSGMIKGYMPQCSLLQGKSPSEPLLYMFAAACLWRLGMKVQVVSFHKAAGDISKSIDPGAQVIFVEKVSGLWDPAKAAALDFFIAAAYHKNLYLWVELVSQPEDLRAGATVAAGSALGYSRKISELKSRSLVDFLSKETYSRLLDITATPLSLL
jgi:hypothetical protein